MNQYVKNSYTIKYVKFVHKCNIKANGLQQCPLSLESNTVSRGTQTSYKHIIQNTKT